MSELSDLVGVLGAIDDYVVEHPELIPEVAQLLRPYRYGAAGWFPVFREWVASRPDLDDESHVEIPTLDDGLRGLSELDEDSEHQDVGLRLLTIAVLGRANGDYAPDGANVDLTLGALSIPGLAAGDTGRAEKLLQLLTDSARFPTAQQWDTMMQLAVEERLIEPDSAQPLRCRGEIVEVDLAGHPHPASAITTRLIADDLAFDDATGFLDPSQWPKCCPAWCAMNPANPAPDGSERYEEIIGLACPQPLLTTCLEFKKVTATTPRMALVGYVLSPPSTPDCLSDGEVLVDEGSIEVRDRAPDPGVSVTTTKRVLFKSVPPGPLAMFSCIFGYADMGDLLLYRCARRHPEKGKPKKGKKPKKYKGQPPPTGDASDCAEIIHDLATLAKDCVTDGAASYKKNYEKAVAGKYTTNDAAADVATVLKRTTHDVAKAIDLGNRAVAATRQGAPEAEPEESE
ncbi:MAG: hypothetical protein ACXVKN_11695 [Acidimicrobiia bacterium]